MSSVYTRDMGNIRMVGHADDREEWLELRKQYLTASSIFTWREVDHPGWWSDKRDDIINEKFHGEQKVFPWEAQVSMAHGSFDEENIMRKLGKALGAYVEPTNAMFVNNRWPDLAATLDGFLYPPVAPPSEDQFCQDPKVIPELWQKLRELGELGRPEYVLEIKKSVSKGWQTKVPDYYVSQVQTQLAIMEMDYGVIVAETLYQQGRRQFWDLRPYLLKADPAWGDVLDQCQEEFLQAKIKHGVDSW